MAEQREATKDAPKCCFGSCDEPAEFEIHDENDPDPYSGYTQACADHVGHLLGHRVGLENPVDHWNVYAV